MWWVPKISGIVLYSDTCTGTCLTTGPTPRIWKWPDEGNHQGAERGEHSRGTLVESGAGGSSPETIFEFWAPLCYNHSKDYIQYQPYSIYNRTLSYMLAHTAVHTIWNVEVTVV